MLLSAVLWHKKINKEKKKKNTEYDGNENRLWDWRYAEAAPHSSGLLAEDGETLRTRRLENNGWEDNTRENCRNMCKQWKRMSYDPLSEGWNHYRDPLWPKQDLQAVFTCDQQIRGAGMQQYLCFFMPFFCGIDPLFFWLPPSASASLKLDSDPPSQDSSESKPEEDTRARLQQVWEQSLNRVLTEIIITHSLFLYRFEPPVSLTEINPEISTFRSTFRHITKSYTTILKHDPIRSIVK